MKKMPTLIKIEYLNGGDRVPTNEIQVPWIDERLVFATRKWNGTAAMVYNGKLFKRFDLKTGRTLPKGRQAIECCAADTITGHHPHWVECLRNAPEDKFFWEAFDKEEKWENGTYELVGVGINGNPEGLSERKLIPHGRELVPSEHNSIAEVFEYLQENPTAEGVVFWRNAAIDCDKCKLRRKDFKDFRIIENWSEMLHSWVWVDCGDTLPENDFVVVGTRLRDSNGQEDVLLVGYDKDKAWDFIELCSENMLLIEFAD